MKKVVLKLDVHDEKGKQKALKRVSSFSGIESISMDMTEQELTVIGDADPVAVVNELRKDWNADILTVVPAKEEKKENGKKEGPAIAKEEEKNTNDVRQKAELVDRKKKAEIKKLLYESEGDSIYRHMASTSWFFTCFPGSEIPSWFNHQSVGHSLTIRLLPYEHRSSRKWIGLAVCAFFEELDFGDSCLITLNFDIKGFKSRSYFLEYPEGSTFMSNQVFFIFFPRGKFPELLAVSDSFEVEFRSSIQKRNTNNEFEVRSVRVMNWGFRMVYEEDREDQLVQFNEPNRSSNSINGLHSEELRILDVNSIIASKNIEGKCFPE